MGFLTDRVHSAELNCSDGSEDLSGLLQKGIGLTGVWST